MTAPAIAPLEAAHAESYAEYAPASRAPPLPPSFLFGPMPDWLAGALFGEFDLGAVGCYSFRKTRVTWDGILLQQNTALWSAGLNHPQEHLRDVFAKALPGWADLPVRRLAGRVAVIHGPGLEIYGHWLIDFLPRLYVLCRAGLDIANLSFALPVQTPGFARDFLRLAGVPAERIVWFDQQTEMIEPDELIMPTILRLRSRFNALLMPATRFWLDRFGRNAGAARNEAGPSRIFVSRVGLPDHRSLAHGEEIEQMARAAGYTILHPQALPLLEQVHMFRHARIIIGAYGSGLHNAIFANPGTVVGALRGTSHHPGFAQSGLAERCGHRIGYIFGPTSEHAIEQTIPITPKLFRIGLDIAELWSSLTGP